MAFSFKANVLFKQEKQNISIASRWIGKRCTSKENANGAIASLGWLARTGLLRVTVGGWMKEKKNEEEEKEEVGG
ncbi:hypothetical protein M0802_007527 [Mischocyttarus mexicanus]|nr:hypothetical protein M0802_007527 [Mischocyttarus mexicanus]